MNESSDRIYSVSAGIDRNLPQPTTVYDHRFIASGSYRFPTGFLPNTARFLAVFTGNTWEYCCQETLTWVFFQLCLTVHSYLTQSFQKFEAENFFRNTVVQPVKRLEKSIKRTKNE